jgi:hypothetical protein
MFGATNKTRYELIDEEDMADNKKEEGLLTSLRATE